MMTTGRGGKRLPAVPAAALGASNYTYAVTLRSVLWTGSLPYRVTFAFWSQRRSFRQPAVGHHQGGFISAVNRTYAWRWRPHYDTAVPARPAAARQGCQGGSSSAGGDVTIIAKARIERFPSTRRSTLHLEELVRQSTIRRRDVRHLGTSWRFAVRRERPALQKLLVELYLTRTKERKVYLDYYVSLSVRDIAALPARHWWARIAARTIEVFHRGERVAAHIRSSSNR